MLHTNSWCMWLPHSDGVQSLKILQYYNIRCISVPQTHSQRGLKICVWLWQGVDTLMPGHLQHTAANIDADLQHTAVKSHVRCDPTLHATNIYFNCFIFQQTNITINPHTSLWWPETTFCPSILFLSLSLSDFSWHSWHSSEVSIKRTWMNF